jgi:hypothetical protein
MVKLAEEALFPRKRVMVTFSSDFVEPRRQLADISIDPACEGKVSTVNKAHKGRTNPLPPIGGLRP